MCHFYSLGSTCNHVAALLFKLDYAFQHGMTNSCLKACTSGVNKWISPALTAVEPMRARDMVIQKPHYVKKLRPVSGGRPVRKLFSPITSTRDKKRPNVDELVNILYPHCPTSVAFNYALPDAVPRYPPQSDVNVGLTQDCMTSERIPDPLFVYARQFSSAEEMCANLPTYSAEQTAMIEESTREQALSETWFAQRRGRISASTCYRVMTKCKTLESDSTVSISSLLTDITSSKQTALNVASLNYGRATEPIAVNVYCLLQNAQHMRLTVEKCGLFVSGQSTHLCASPDRIVACDCCGHGLLEVKCPFSCIDVDPKLANLAYLDNRSGEIKLKREHSYYAQVQMQMGVLERQWCDFFVYSKGGIFLERIEFDRDYWDILQKVCLQFYIRYVVPELVNSAICEAVVAPF